MRVIAQPCTNTERYEAQAASDARWLLALIAWCGAVFEHFAPLVRTIPWLAAIHAGYKTKAARDLRRCIARLRIIVTEHAYARMRFSTQLRSDRLPPGARRGQSLQARRHVRFYRRVARHLFADMHRGSLRQRAERLAAIYANLEPLIARAQKRLAAMWRFFRTTRHALAVTHVACVTRTTPAAAFADTS